VLLETRLYNSWSPQAMLKPAPELIAYKRVSLSFLKSAPKCGSLSMFIHVEAVGNRVSPGLRRT
jgi:hypothetical protein